MDPSSYSSVPGPRSDPFSFAANYVSSQVTVHKREAPGKSFSLSTTTETTSAAGGELETPKTFELPIMSLTEDWKQAVEVPKNNAQEEEEEGDDADYAEVIPSSKPAGSQVWTSSQKKRADYDAFDSWLTQNRDDINKITKGVAATLTDEDKTAAALVREFESAKIIESPRDYQIELFEKAKQKNIIAVLDTG